MSSHARRSRRSLRTTATAAGIAALGVSFAGNALAAPQLSTAPDDRAVESPALPAASTLEGLQPQMGGSLEESELLTTLWAFGDPSIDMGAPTADEPASGTRLSEMSAITNGPSATEDNVNSTSGTDADSNSTDIGEDGEVGQRGLPQPALDALEGAGGEPELLMSANRLTENRVNHTEVSAMDSIATDRILQDMIAEALAGGSSLMN